MIRPGVLAVRRLGAGIARLHEPSMQRLALAAALTLVACSAAKKNTAPSVTPTATGRRDPPSAAAARRAAEAAQAPARSHQVGTIARKAVGPFAAKSAAGGLIAWIVGAERGGGEELTTVTLGADGAPLGTPRVVASIAQDATTLVVQPPGGTRGGWLVAYSALLDRGESLSVLGLAPDGTARAAAVDVQRTSDHVKWVDLVPTSRGAACVWAEETASGEANILTASIDPDGKPRGMPVRIARGVDGWAAVHMDAPASEGEDGVGIALVAARPDGAPSAQKGRSLSWLRLDAEGRPVGSPIAVGATPTVYGDVDAVPVRGGVLLGWTDRTGEDAQVVLAQVDAGGRVHGPKRAMDAVGGSTLVGLASGAQGAALAWEEPHGRARPTRTLHLASVSVADAPVAQPVTSLQIAARGTPELAATDGGFAVLASARSCGPGEAAGTCEGPVVPTYVRFDARLSPAQAEPMLVGDTRTEAALGWGLRCAGDRCFALAATSESPTPIFTVDLAPRASPFAAPSAPAPPASAPRVIGVDTLASGQPFADVAAIRVGRAAFVAALANAPGAPGARARRRPDRAAAGAAAAAARAPGGTTITLRRVGGDGALLGPATSVTSRAVPVGGVGLAPAGRPEDGAALAWVARDDGDPQVHVARVDANGRRGGEMQLTTVPGDASDVAIAWAGDGWLVAWVDTRDGNGEVYAAKVDRDLKRVGREVRVTRASGDAGDVALAVAGDRAFVAWSDARESPREGLADVYVAPLSARDARRAGDEVRVLATAGHSRSPELLPVGDGVLLAWIEDAPTGVDAPRTAMIARLDAQGHPMSTARLPFGADDRPTAIALEEGAGDGARVVVASTARDEMSLQALRVSADGVAVGPPWHLLDLDAPGSFDVTLALAGQAAFFVDMGSSAADHRVRRAAIAWPR
jgi:hypothetical protein